ncbi:hypothetical protein DRJ17_05385 [Candidatus Woesearchaeota archaeon]|nr:MAG: hypothetical protein DRJ17_05385 [Candidatus Woesearchaeota archaeon]
MPMYDNEEELALVRRRIIHAIFIPKRETLDAFFYDISKYKNAIVYAQRDPNYKDDLGKWKGHIIFEYYRWYYILAVDHRLGRNNLPVSNIDLIDIRHDLKSARAIIEEGRLAERQRIREKIDILYLNLTKSTNLTDYIEYFSDKLPSEDILDLKEKVLVREKDEHGRIIKEKIDYKIILKFKDETYLFPVTQTLVSPSTRLVKQKYMYHIKKPSKVQSLEEAIIL